MASIQNKTDQLRFTGKGPLDAKSLVKTYANLLSVDTWTVDGTLVAYNGMITAVWLDKTTDDNGNTRNGIYYFFDPAVTSVVTQKNADVTNPANWHRLDTSDLASSLSAIEASMDSLDDRLTALEDADSIVVATYGYRKDFPANGEGGKLYIATDEGKSYIWFNSSYLAISGAESAEPDMICGGTALS